MAQQLKAKNFDVQPGHMLCRQCITDYENIINASSSETDVEETPMDDTDEEALDDATYEVYKTPRKRLNTSLETVGVSPVNLHGVPQHSHATSAKQKLGKVVDTYESTIAEAYDVSKWLCFWGKWCTVESSRVRTAAWCYEGEIENCFVSWEDSDTDTDPR